MDRKEQGKNVHRLDQGGQRKAAGHRLDKGSSGRLMAFRGPVKAGSHKVDQREPGMANGHGLDIGSKRRKADTGCTMRHK